MRKIIVFWLCISLMASLVIEAQNLESKRYLSNIVDIGNSEFGYIVGAQNNTIYFVTVTGKTETRPPTVPIRFYRSDIKGDAVLVKRFVLEQGALYLYAYASSITINWQNYSYRTLSNGAGPFYSYLDNNRSRSDSLWYFNSSPLVVNDKIADDVLQLKISKGDYFYRGMPVMDAAGRIGGIVMERQDEEDQTSVFLILDIKTVQKKLDDLKKCGYFQLVEFGQVGTPCDIEKKQAEIKIKENELVRKNNAIHFISAGPSASLHYSASSSGVENYGFAAFGFSAGLNIYLNPDKGRLRVTLKPRYSYTPMGVHKDYPAEASIGFRPSKFLVSQFESPVMLEWITKRATADLQSFIGLGYVPGYQFPLVYKYTTTSDTKKQKDKEESVKGYSQKIAFEIGLAAHKTRISFNVQYQFSNWADPMYTRSINNYQISPTNGAGGGFVMLGLEIATRLSGSWGLKSK